MLTKWRILQFSTVLVLVGALLLLYNVYVFIPQAGEYRRNGYKSRAVQGCIDDP